VHAHDVLLKIGWMCAVVWPQSVTNIFLRNHTLERGAKRSLLSELYNFCMRTSPAPCSFAWEGIFYSVCSSGTTRRKLCVSVDILTSTTTNRQGELTCSQPCVYMLFELSIYGPQVYNHLSCWSFALVETGSRADITQKLPRTLVCGTYLESVSIAFVCHIVTSLLMTKENSSR
jgi:hypothetical protein